MRILMLPHLDQVKLTSGIDQVIKAYFQHLPNYGIQLVPRGSDDFDLLAVHASGNLTQLSIPSVCHTHGLHWTADYNCASWQYNVNMHVINTIRYATEVTVPSAWVAETFQRDMRFTPTVIPHGIEWDEWQHNESVGDYVLWNKNRGLDVCDPAPVGELAKIFNRTHFVTTFLPRNAMKGSNVNVTGLIPHDQMKRLVQSAMVYLATTKETFGIGTLEAMASGVPVLGFSHGGNADLIEHGVNGYLAKYGDYEDLAKGLEYCIRHRDTLGANGREMAKLWTWDVAAEKVAGVYHRALHTEPATVGVVIPVYNKSESDVRRAIDSVRNQSFRVAQCVIVDDGSTNGIGGFIKRYVEDDGRFQLITQRNSGVAVARNQGISSLRTKYVCPLDSDDWIGERFIEACVDELEKDKSLGIVYTGLKYYKPDGATGVSQWPGEFNYDRQLKRQNQIPTCCLFRREMWERLGGYRQRYAPHGCGSEDAEFWTRAGAYGWNAKQVGSDELEIYRIAQDHWQREPTENELLSRGLSFEDQDLLLNSFFHYSWLSGMVTGNPDYREVDWLAWHPWVRDGKHPFASMATPSRFSHPVRQYDEPTVSVIIPVGPGHEQHVINALDSLEAQTFRNWEAIVIWDTWGDPSNDAPVSLEYLEILRAYPYVKLIDLTNHPEKHWPFDERPIAYLDESIRINGSKGTGYSRNRGAEISRAPFLFFLDADDTLYPEALQKHIDAWNDHQAIIYSGFVSKSIVNEKYKNEMEQEDRLLSILKEWEENGEKRYLTVAKAGKFDYDCEKAQRQPEADERGNYYIWCNVTALIPKSWHDSIDGFDESMHSWEDVEYHWRLSKAGYCYHRIDDDLCVYNFHQGHRRERGRQNHKNLILYITEKHERMERVACSSCGKSKKRQVARQSGGVFSRSRPQQQVIVDDSDFVLCLYSPPGKGAKHVTGAATFPMKLEGWKMLSRGREAYSIRYGRRDKGQQFLVHREDVKLQPTLFIPIIQREVTNAPEPVEQELEPPKLKEGARVAKEIAPVPEPELTTVDDVLSESSGMVDDILSTVDDRKFDLQMLPGVGPALAEQLEDAGINSRERLLELGIEGLSVYKGVGPIKAERIIKAVSSRE